MIKQTDVVDMRTVNRVNDTKSYSEMCDRLDNKYEGLEAKREAVTDHAIDQNTRAAKSELDIYSNEKAKKQNELYHQYMDESIGDNFKDSVNLSKDKISFMESSAKDKLELDKLKFEFEMEMQKKRLEAEEIIRNAKIATKDKWIWRIFWPVMGIIAACIIYFGLNYFNI